MALYLVLEDWAGFLGGPTGAQIVGASTLLDDTIYNIPQILADGCPLVLYNPGTMSAAKTAFDKQAGGVAQINPDGNLLALLYATGAIGGGGDLATTLAAGNLTGANDILVTGGQAVDAALALGTLLLGTGNAKLIALGNKLAALADDDPMIVVNQGGVTFISNAGIQYSTKRANRAQFRGNQFGANAAGPGATGFKSRGVNIGDLASVAAGDLLFRITAIGVPADNASVPLAALLSLQVPVGGVGPNYVATEYELQLVPLEGPINGAKVMFKVTSQGVPVLRETALPAGGTVAGLAITGAGGTIAVANPSVKKPGTRITLTIQPGGVIPTGGVYVSALVNGTSFTIQSLTGDVGVEVYWQLWEGI